MKKRLLLPAIVMATGCVAAALVTPTLGNAWSLATGRGFFIPAESSVFTFRVTQENPGSGEWWLHGEDNSNFFALHPTQAAYVVQSRAGAAACAGFMPLSQQTWCSPRVVRTLP